MIRRVLLLSIAAVISATAAFSQTCMPGATWCSGAYAYDGAGNIRAIGSDVYIYDTAGRLVSGTADVQRTNPANPSRQDYGYDAFGNRISASRAPGSIDCLGGCELSPTISTTTNHITSNGALYDDVGNLTFIQNVAGNTTYNATYTWDTAGRLARAAANTDVRDFLYTADDERIATANGASWTWTVRERGVKYPPAHKMTSAEASAFREKVSAVLNKGANVLADTFVVLELASVFAETGGGGTEAAIEKVETDASELESAVVDDVVVVRGGQNNPENFTNGSGVTVDANGKLQNVSVNSAPAKTAQELSATVPHNQIGITTVAQVQGAGGQITPAPTPQNPDHCTMDGLTPQDASKLFTPVVPNPNKVGGSQ